VWAGDPKRAGFSVFVDLAEKMGRVPASEYKNPMVAESTPCHRVALEVATSIALHMLYTVCHDEIVLLYTVVVQFFESRDRDDATFAVRVLHSIIFGPHPDAPIWMIEELNIVKAVVAYLARFASSRYAASDRILADLMSILGRVADSETYLCGGTGGTVVAKAFLETESAGLVLEALRPTSDPEVRKHAAAIARQFLSFGHDCSVFAELGLVPVCIDALAAGNPDNTDWSAVIEAVHDAMGLSDRLFHMFGSAGIVEVVTKKVTEATTLFPVHAATELAKRCLRREDGKVYAISDSIMERSYFLLASLGDDRSETGADPHEDRVENPASITRPATDDDVYPPFPKGSPDWGGESIDGF
jgi:hypothetical protein